MNLTTCAALIVEDDQNVQRMLQYLLKKHCASVDIASDGDAAIAMLQKSTYGLVVLDLMLPKTNGFQVAEAIGNLPYKPRLIVHSAIARYFENSFPEGTVVLQKPFDIGHIEEELQKLA